MRDGRGHEETIATVQIDFNQPERFDLTYQGREGSKRRVVMIHRGTVGAMERVVASLLERYQGRLPLWLAPVQAVIMPVGETHDSAADDAFGHLRRFGLRAQILREGSLGSRIREARRMRASIMVVIGDRETNSALVQATDGGDGTQHRLPPAELADRMATAHRQRTPMT